MSDTAVVDVTTSGEHAPTRTTIVGRRGGTLTPFDSAAASEASRRRWQNVGRAARLGIGDAGQQIPDVNKRAPLAVVRYVVSQHTLNAADPSARGAAASFRQVMALAYPEPEREVSQSPAAQPGLTLNLDAGALRALLVIVKARLASE